MTKESVSGNFDISNMSRGVHLRNTPRIFMASSTLDAEIWITNQNIEKSLTLFWIDAL